MPPSTSTAAIALRRMSDRDESKVPYAARDCGCRDDSNPMHPSWDAKRGLTSPSRQTSRLLRPEGDRRRNPCYAPCRYPAREHGNNRKACARHEVRHRVERRHAKERRRQHPRRHQRAHNAATDASRRVELAVRQSRARSVSAGRDAARGPEATDLPRSHPR